MSEFEVGDPETFKRPRTTPAASVLARLRSEATYQIITWGSSS